MFVLLARDIHMYTLACTRILTETNVDTRYTLLREPKYTYEN